MPSSAGEKNTKPQASEKSNISLWSFFDRSKPWVLVKGGSFLGYFDFVPESYRHGPWSKVALLCFPTLIYLLAVGAIWVDGQKPADGWWAGNTLLYEAFTSEWYYTTAAFCWMTFMCWNVYFRSPMGGSAWISFTLWSWTTITVRHGLCVLAPFVPSSSPICLVAEILRFPALLSASMTFLIWNFILFPVILVFFIRDSATRKSFFGYMTNFRLTQLHVFNIWFAVANAALIKPIRCLHLGDLVAMGVMMVTYMCWYYFVLDRVGIHLYPIFTPRSSFVVFGWALIVFVCVGGFYIWKDILEKLVHLEGGESGLSNNLLFLLGYFKK